MTNATLVKLEVAKKVVKDLNSEKPAVALKAAEVVLEKVKVKQVQKEPVVKTVKVEMTVPRPKVTFTGEGWCAVDVKLAYASVVRSFREMQRELYRKEYKKK